MPHIGSSCMRYSGPVDQELDAFARASKPIFSMCDVTAFKYGRHRSPFSPLLQRVRTRNMRPLNHCIRSTECEAAAMVIVNNNRTLQSLISISLADCVVFRFAITG